MKTLLLISGLLILASGSSCLDSQTVLPGQVGLITDAAAISCQPYAQTTDAHQCLLLASPSQEAVKIFDATDNQFVLAPVAYFPLVIKAGQAPNRIATINNRIFTLDPKDQGIYEIPASFISPLGGNKIPLGFSPNDFALSTDAQGKIIAFVSSTSGITQVALEGQALPSGYSLPGPVQKLQINTNYTYLLIAHESTLTIADPNNSQNQKSLDLGASIISMTSDATKALLGLSDKTLVMVDLATASKDATSPTLTEVAAVVYLPSTVSGTPAPCCNGEKNWVGALTRDGVLQYWPYQTGAFGKSPQLIDIVLATGVGPYALTMPTKLVGANIPNPVQDGLGCERRLFLVYSGAIFNTCEGISNIKRVDQTE